MKKPSGQSGAGPRAQWRWLAALCLGLLSAAAAAQTIYTWTDENGILNFSDRKPVTEAEVRARHAEAQPDDPVVARKEESDGLHLWFYRNRLHGPVTVQLSLVESDSIVSEPALPATFELAALEEQMLVGFGPLDPYKSWSYRISSSSQPGSRRARHAPRKAYRPPIAAGTEVLVGQAFGGRQSHRDRHSYHAVDLQTPQGTPVYAARGGVVMDTARHFRRAGDNLEYFGPRANFVRILHDDGSMALYAHLDYGGVSVRDGQRVKRGQRIGRSGNTGFSTGPHLHFVVQVNRSGSLESVPFEFEMPAGRSTKPEKGLVLRVD